MHAYIQLEDSFEKNSSKKLSYKKELCLVQTPLYILGNTKKNSSLHFECYDLSHAMTFAPKIW